MSPNQLDHWSREPGRWTSAMTPEAYATIPTISTPCPSPDGTRVAYSRAYDGRIDLYVIGVDGGTPLQLTDAVTLQGPDPNQRHATSIAWTPDGQQLVFAGNQDKKLWIGRGRRGTIPCHRRGTRRASFAGRCARWATRRVCRRAWRARRRHRGGPGRPRVAGDQRGRRPRAAAALVTRRHASPLRTVAPLRHALG